MISPIVITVLVSILGILVLVLSIFLFNTTDESVVSITPTPTPTVQYSKYLYIPIYSTTTSSLAVIDTDSLKIAASSVFTGASAKESCFAFLSQDQQTLYVVNKGGSGSVTVMNVIDTTNISVVVILEFLVHNIPEMSSPTGGCISPDGSLLYIACNGTTAGGIAIYNIVDYSFNQFLTLPQLQGPDAIVPDVLTNYLYISNSFATPATISQLDTTTNQIIHTFTLTPGTQLLQKFVVSADLPNVAQNLYAVASAPTDNVLPLSIFDIASHNIVNTAPLGINCHQVAVSNDGNTLFVLSNNSFIPVDITNRNSPVILTDFVKALPPNSQPYGITCDEKHIFISDSIFPTIYVFNVDQPYLIVSNITIEGVSRWTNDLRIL